MKNAARVLPLSAVLWLLVLVFAFPLLWFLLSSFKPGSELFSLPMRLLPEDWTLEGYRTAWTRFDFWRYFLNTGLVAIVTTLLTVVVSAMTGYAFAKYKAWWLQGISSLHPGHHDAADRGDHAVHLRRDP